MKIIRDKLPKPVKKGRGRPKGTGSRKGKIPQKRYIKIKRFVSQYLIDLNAMKAYQRCGYGTGNDQADSANGNKLLDRPDVQQLIAEAEEKRAKEVNITQEMVLKELALLAFANIKDISTWDGNNMILKPFDELTRDQTAIISSIGLKRTAFGDFDLRFTTPSAQDKRGALVDLGKHLGMFWEAGRQEDPIEFARKSHEALNQMEDTIGSPE
jgi:phage terminase small subunit